MSAGAILMTPDISYAEFCGDRNYIGLKDLKGLELVNFCYVPHAKEVMVSQNTVAKSKQDNSQVIVADDSDHIIVNDSEILVYGQPKLLVSGEIVVDHLAIAN